jgi:hypothetical protein
MTDPSGSDYVSYFRGRCHMSERPFDARTIDSFMTLGRIAALPHNPFLKQRVMGLRAKLGIPADGFRDQASMDVWIDQHPDLDASRPYIPRIDRQNLACPRRRPEDLVAPCLPEDPEDEMAVYRFVVCNELLPAGYSVGDQYTNLNRWQPDIRMWLRALKTRAAEAGNDLRFPNMFDEFLWQSKLIIEEFRLPPSMQWQFMFYVVSDDMDPCAREWNPLHVAVQEAHKDTGAYVEARILGINPYTTREQWYEIWRTRVEPHIKTLRKELGVKWGTKRATVQSWGKDMQLLAEWYRLFQNGDSPAEIAQRWKEEPRGKKKDLYTENGVRKAVAEFRELIEPAPLEGQEG